MVNAGLSRHGREVGSVFDLLGRDENDLTAALAYTLARSPALLSRVLHRILPAGDDAAVTLRLEERGGDGRTDLEIEAGTQLAVIEAKRGWLLPDFIQLGKYAPRIARHGGGALVTLSSATPGWTYCVSVSNGRPGNGGPRTYRDYVTSENC